MTFGRRSLHDEAQCPSVKAPRRKLLLVPRRGASNTVTKLEQSVDQGEKSSGDEEKGFMAIGRIYDRGHDKRERETQRPIHDIKRKGRECYR